MIVAVIATSGSGLGKTPGNVVIRGISIQETWGSGVKYDKALLSLRLTCLSIVGDAAGMKVW